MKYAAGECAAAIDALQAKVDEVDEAVASGSVAVAPSDVDAQTSAMAVLCRMLYKQQRVDEATEFLQACQDVVHMVVRSAPPPPTHTQHTQTVRPL